MKKILILAIGLFFTTVISFGQVEYTTTGAGNAYVLVFPSQMTALTSGLSFTFKANHTNTGAATLNINALGAVTIKFAVTADLKANDILNGQEVTVVYDGTNFQMMTPSGDLSGGAEWTLLGNAGTNDATNFIGTTDAQDIVFKANNITVMTLEQGEENVGIGITNPAWPLQVESNDELKTGYFKNVFTTASQTEGIYGTAEGSGAGTHYGGYFTTKNGTGTSIGVGGFGVDGDTVIGIYGDAKAGSAVNYAGYFDGGDVFVKNNLILPTGAANGSVLTSDATGNATWQVPSGSGWSLSGNAITLGNKLGTTNAQDLILQAGGSDAIKIDDVSQNVSIGGSIAPLDRLAVVTSGTIGIQTGIHNIQNSLFDGTKFGIDNIVNSAGEGIKYGFRSTVTQDNGTAFDVYGNVSDVTNNGSGANYALYQLIRGTTSTGTQYAIYNDFLTYTGAGTTYGIYNDGEDYNYFSGNLGIGTTTPNEELVIGTNFNTGWAIPAATIGDATGGGALEVGSYNGTVATTHTLAIESGATFGRAKITATNGGAAGNGNIEFVANGVGIGVVPNEKLTVEGVLSLREISGVTSTLNYGKFYADQGDNHPHFIASDGVDYDLTLGDGWGLTGNAGTTNGTNFIGTTDAQDLDIRTNNIIKHRFTQQGQLEFLNTGSSVFVGNLAGENDDLSNNFNVFVGERAGESNTTGSQSVAIGYRSLSSASGSSSNTSVGFNSLRSTTGFNNTAIGFQAGRSLTGSNNTAIGYQTLFSTSGNGNVGLGRDAGISNTTGNDNIFIGKGADALTNNLTNAIAIGANAVVSQSNSLILGNAVNVGIGTSAPEEILEVNGNIKQTTDNDKFMREPGVTGSNDLVAFCYGNVDGVNGGVAAPQSLGVGSTENFNVQYNATGHFTITYTGNRVFIGTEVMIQVSADYKQGVPVIINYVVTGSEEFDVYLWDAQGGVLIDEDFSFILYGAQ